MLLMLMMLMMVTNHADIDDFYQVDADNHYHADADHADVDSIAVSLFVYDLVEFNKYCIYCTVFTVQYNAV